MGKERGEPKEQTSVPLFVDNELIEPAEDIVSGLHVAGFPTLDLEPITPKNDRFGLRNKLSNLRNKTPFMLRGSPEAVDAYKRVYEKTQEFVKNHKAATGGIVTASLVAGIAYLILKEAQKGKLPHHSVDSKDFE